MSWRYRQRAAPAVVRDFAVANDELAVLEDQRRGAEHLRPVGIIGVIMAMLLLKEQKKTSIEMKFDWTGAGTLFGGLTCLLLFFNMGGRLGFTSIPVLALAAGTVVLITLFVITERRVAQPILNLGFFKNRIFTSGVVSMCIMFLCVSANTLLTPYYLTKGLEHSNAQAGLLFAVISGSTLIVGPFSGWLSDKIGSRVLCTAGITLISLALFLLSRLGPESTTPEIILRFAILGSGLGMFSSPNNSSIMGSVPRESLSTGSAMIATMRQVGMSSGMAISGAIFAWLTGDLPIDTLDTLSIVDAYRYSILVAAIICGTGIIASWARGSRLTREQEV